MGEILYYTYNFRDLEIKIEIKHIFYLSIEPFFDISFVIDEIKNGIRIFLLRGREHH